MIVGIILAAGKGTRIKAKNRNKVTLPFLNKPLITYAVELLNDLTDKVVVVIGAYHESVRTALKNYEVVFVYQRKRLGTAHATKVGMDELGKINIITHEVIVAYGDHTMFYKKQTIQNLIEIHRKQKSSVTFITTNIPDPFGYGRIIRDSHNKVVAIVEHKNANSAQLKINEINAGFYCFDYEYLKRYLCKIKKSFESKEYYLTDLIEIALKQNKKVIGLNIPFSEVGIGINRPTELEESQKLYLEGKK